MSRLGEFSPEKLGDVYGKYYREQSGSGSGVSVYKGRRVVRGGGIGSVFKGFINSIKPSLIAGTKSLGKRAFKTFGRVALDALDGKNVLASTKKRFKDSAKDLLGDVFGDGNTSERASPAPTSTKSSSKSRFLRAKNKNKPRRRQKSIF